MSGQVVGQAWAKDQDQAKVPPLRPANTAIGAPVQLRHTPSMFEVGRSRFDVRFPFTLTLVFPFKWVYIHPTTLTDLQGLVIRTSPEIPDRRCQPATPSLRRGTDAFNPAFGPYAADRTVGMKEDRVFVSRTPVRERGPFCIAPKSPWK